MNLDLSRDVDSKLNRIFGEYFGGGPSVSNVLTFNSLASVHKTAEPPAFKLSFDAATL